MHQRNTTPPGRGLALALVAGAALLLAACGGAEGGTGGGTPTATPAVEPITLDWSQYADIDLGDGLVLGNCGGDGPLRCVRDGDGDIGIVELSYFTLGEDLEAAVQRDGVQAALEAHIDEFHETIEADRAIGCGPAYEYRPTPTRRVTFGAEPGIAYGFTAHVDGIEVERVRGYMTVADGLMWILASTAAAPGSCLDDDLLHFAPERLEALEGHLERLAQGSIFSARG